MEINDYQRRAMATLNPELAWKDVLLNSVMGLCGESGEAIDIVKNGFRRGTRLTARTLPRNWAISRGTLQRQPQRWRSRWRRSCKATSISCKNAIRTASMRKSPSTRGKRAIKKDA